MMPLRPPPPPSQSSGWPGLPRVLPDSTNYLYRGPKWVAYAVTLLGASELLPALIHMFAPDGGAFRIAHLDPAAGPATIIALFAWAGATQFAFAGVVLAVALRYRNFLSAILVLMLFEKALIALNGWVLKSGHTGHHPPGQYAVLVVLPVLVMLFLASTPKRR